VVGSWISIPATRVRLPPGYLPRKKKPIKAAQCAFNNDYRSRKAYLKKILSRYNFYNSLCYVFNIYVNIIYDGAEESEEYLCLFLANSCQINEFCFVKHLRSLARMRSYTLSQETDNLSLTTDCQLLTKKALHSSKKSLMCLKKFH